MTSSKPSYKSTVYIVAITAALAGLLFGVDMGVISGALTLLHTDFHLTADQQEFVVSSILIGAVIGALCAGYISRHYGRRSAIMVSAFIFFLGSILSAISTSYEMLIGVRIFLGLALGVASFTAPIYLSEVAPKRVRGALISLYQFMITIGLLLAFVVDLVLAPYGDWRYMLGAPAVPAFIMFVAMFFLPRSPRWLMLKGFKRAAIGVLHRIHHRPDIHEELTDMRKSIHSRYSMMEMITNPMLLRVIILGVVLQLIQQFSGMNTAMYYAPEIFKAAGFATPAEQMWGTVIVGLINVLTTIVAIFLVDRFGRRPLLFFGFACMILGFVVLGGMMYLGTTNMTESYIAAIALLVFIVGFAISLGPVIWILCSEIYPLKGRDVGVTFSTTANWVGNTIVGATFLTFLNTLGTSGTFWMYAIIGVISLIICARFVPETKDVSLEHIEENLMAGKSLRELGQVK